MWSSSSATQEKSYREYAQAAEDVIWKGGGASTGGPPSAGSDFLYYDNDTLPGNSGSPVIGRGSKDGDYAVKGIHIRGNVGINTAQGLQKLKDWI